MVLTEYRLFGFQFISLYFGFYVLGYLLRKYSIQFALTHIIVLGVIWFALALFWRMHAVPAPFQWASNYIPSSLITYGYRYITAFIGSLFFISLAMKFMNVDNATCRMLSYFGKRSLGIYIIHLFLMKFVEPLYINYFSDDTSALFILSDFSIKIILSLVIMMIIQKAPIIRLLLLGQK